MVTYAVVNRIRVHVADMKDFFESRRKHINLSIMLNIFAGLINAGAWYNSIFNLDGWIGWCNFPLIFVGFYTAFNSWRRLEVLEQDKRAYVEDILRGKYG